jgi:hypothetical protein
MEAKYEGAQEGTQPWLTAVWWKKGCILRIQPSNDRAVRKEVWGKQAKCH